MPRNSDKPKALKLPLIKAGTWQCELGPGGTSHQGQVLQPGPPIQSVEFTYIVSSALLTMPNKNFTWPGVVMIMAPTPMKETYCEAGLLIAASPLPSLHLSLNVTRPQYSDLLRMWEGGRVKALQFTIDAERNGEWPVQSWGITTSLI